MKKTIIIVLVAAIVITAGIVGYKAYNNDDKKITGVATQGSLTKEDFNKEIPFYYQGKHMYVDVVINQKTYTFAFDTGCDITSIDKSLVDELNFSAKVKQKVTGSSFSETEVQYGTMGNPMTLGGLEFSNMGIGLQDLSFLKALESDFTDGRKITGIVGTNFMKKAFWQIDYTTGTLTASDKVEDFTSGDNMTTVDMIPKNTENWGTNQIKVTMNGYSDNFFLDTGSYGSFSASDKFLEKLNKNAKPAVTEKGTNAKSESRFFNIDTMKVGPLEFQNQELLIQKGIGSLIGNAFLENYVVTVDFQNNKLYLNPNS